MAHDVEAATPLLGGDDARTRSRGSSRPVVIALGSLAFAALIGLGVYTHSAGPLPGLDLLKGKERPTPVMYALMGETQGLPQQLRSLQCYAKMARETGSELVVGPVKTKAVNGGEDEYVSFDAIVKPEPGTWRAMTKDDRAAFLTHNLDRGCITALREQDTIGTTFVSPGDETVRSDPFTSAKDYQSVVDSIKERGGKPSCVASAVYAECEEPGTELDFQASKHIELLSSEVRKFLFGAADRNFRVVHARSNAATMGMPVFKSFNSNQASINIDPFVHMCREAKAGQGLPTYVATDDMSANTQMKLQSFGCKTIHSILGSQKLEDWEMAALDQFMMADATEHYSMRCTTMDIIASSSRRIRQKMPSKWYLDNARKFHEIADGSNMKQCEAGVKVAEEIEEANQPKGEGKQFAQKAEAKARARQAAEDRAAVAAAGRGDDIEIQGLNDADGGDAFAIATFLANEQEKDDPIEKFLREVGRGTAQGR